MIHAIIIGHNVTTQDLNGFCGIGYGETEIAKIRLSSPSADVKSIHLVECFALERGQSDLTTRNVRLDARVVRVEDRDETFNGETIPGRAFVIKIHNGDTEYADDVFVVFAAN